MGTLLSSVLRHRVAIEAPVLTPDGQGGFTKDWQYVETVWAKMEPLSGNEALAGKQITQVASYRVTVRYRAGITPDMRLVWNEQTYNIRSIQDPDGLKRSLEMMAESGE